MDIDNIIGKKVFGFSDEILSNSDLPPFEYSENRQSAAKIVEKVVSVKQSPSFFFHKYLSLSHLYQLNGYGGLFI